MRVSRKERIREINAGKIEREGNSGRWGEKESKRERGERERERGVHPISRSCKM